MVACTNTELSTHSSGYNPDKHSRVRVYGQNGRPAEMFVTIEGKTEKVNVGGSLGQAFSSFIGTKDNESIGIPETEFSKDPSQFGGFLSKAFFKEFVVPAGMEIKVKNSILGTQHRHEDKVFNRTVIYNFKGCSGDMVTFIPQAGKDYEVVPFPSKDCGVTVYEIK